MRGTNNTGTRCWLFVIVVSPRSREGQLIDFEDVGCRELIIRAARYYMYYLRSTLLCCGGLSLSVLLCVVSVVSCCLHVMMTIVLDIILYYRFSLRNPLSLPDFNSSLLWGSWRLPSSLPLCVRVCGHTVLSLLCVFLYVCHLSFCGDSRSAAFVGEYLSLDQTVQ